MKYKISLFILSFFALSFNALSQVQTIITLAGNGDADFYGDGSNASGAALHSPVSVVNDPAGNIYIADFANNRVRKVAITGIITTVAGNGLPGFTGNGTIATTAAVVPKSLALDKNNNLYIADASSHTIRKVDGATGIISTVAGTGIKGFNGNGGLAINARLNTPTGVAVDDSGNVYIADAGNHTVRRVDALGYIHRFAGKDTTAGFSGDFGPALLAELDSPYAVAVDRKSGIVFITDYMNQVIRMVDQNKVITTYAGTPGVNDYTGDTGPANLATLNGPRGMAIDTFGNLYIADAQNNVIRKVSATTANIYTVAGNGTPGFGGDLGLVTGANLFNPYSVAVDVYGTLYIADANNERVRKTYNPKVGVNMIPAGAQIEAYPNPATNNIAISGLAVNDEVAVYDVVGRQVTNKKVAVNGTEMISVAGLANGVYTVQVTGNDGRKALIKIVKD